MEPPKEKELVIEPNFVELPPEGLNIVPAPGGSVMRGGTFQSPDFKVGVSGWRISANGVIEAIKAIFIGVSTLNIKSYTNFETSTRFSTTLTGAGPSATFDENGLTIATSATASRAVQTKWFVTKRLFSGSPTFSVVLYALNVSGDGTGTKDRQRVTDIYNLHAALVAYKAALGNYPTTLSALVPTYISSIPLDPDTGLDYSYAYKNDFTDAHIGAVLESSTSNSLTLDEDFNSNIAGWTNGFSGADPTFDFRMESATDPALPGTASGSGTAFFGIGTVSVNGTTHTFTTAGNACAGFFAERTGGVITLYAIQSNAGSVSQSIALTTIYDTDILDLIVKINGTSSVDYYWRKNLGELSAKTTILTNVPVLKSGVNNQFSTSNNASAVAYDWILVSSSYER